MTGVQTCALPIYRAEPVSREVGDARLEAGPGMNPYDVAAADAQASEVSGKSRRARVELAVRRRFDAAIQVLEDECQIVGRRARRELASRVGRDVRELGDRNPIPPWLPSRLESQP